MPDSEMEAGLKTSVVETKEKPFIPGEKVISVVLEPKPGEEPYFPPSEPHEPLPPDSQFPFLPAPRDKKHMILDIETTGANPWDSRIICISARCVNPGEKIVTFSDPDEKVMLQNFITWFKSKEFNVLIGYNVAFDFRFIYAKCLRYLLKFKVWANLELYDLMNKMKQVKMEFVFGYNKPGGLAQWAALLWDEKKVLSIEEILKAWDDKRIDDIIRHNRRDVELIYKLWLTVQYVEEVIVLGEGT